MDSKEREIACADIKREMDNLHLTQPTVNVSAHTMRLPTGETAMVVLVCPEQVQAAANALLWNGALSKIIQAPQ